MRTVCVKLSLGTPFAVISIAIKKHVCWASFVLEVSYCDIIKFFFCINYARVCIINWAGYIKITRVTRHFVSKT